MLTQLTVPLFSTVIFDIYIYHWVYDKDINKLKNFSSRIISHFSFEICFRHYQFLIYKSADLFAVLKLLKMAKGIRSLLDTVGEALPQVGNLGSLFFLLFFIFAALGVELFGKLGKLFLFYPIQNDVKMWIEIIVKRC